VIVYQEKKKKTFCDGHNI